MGWRRLFRVATQEFRRDRLTIPLRASQEEEAQHSPYSR